MKTILLFSALSGTLWITACQQNEIIQPDQPVILNDSSNYNGRLKAMVYDRSARPQGEAVVSIYDNYNDMVEDLPILTVYSSADGSADLGYVAIGHYYICARKGYRTDTAAAQVISQQITVRNLIVQ